MAIVFDDVRLDEKISYGSRVGPVYRTTIIAGEAGYEQAVQHWSRGRLQMIIGSGLKDRDDAALLIAFFRARAGRARAFRVKDWTDYTTVDQPCLLLTSGADDTYQLQKHYTSGGVTEIRSITKPVSATATVKRNGIAVGSGYSINYATGVLTVSPSLGGTWTWSGQFDVPMRFDTDVMDMNIEAFDTRTWEGIPLIEVLGV